MSTTRLPQLLPLDPAPSMELSQFRKGERAVSVMACENYAKLYAHAYGLAVWKAAMEAAKRVCRENAYQYDDMVRTEEFSDRERWTACADASRTCAHCIAALPSTLDERIARARAELEKKHGPGPFDCQFCGVKTEHPCALRNCMECQNFGYYPPAGSPE